MSPHDKPPGRLAAALAFAFAIASLSPTASAEVRSMIVTSDPQYPWTPASDAGEPEGESETNARSQALIEEQYRSIAAYRAARPGQDIPVFINGDLTAYGHGWQRSMLARLLTILGPNVHFGLGNHDYANNILDGGRGCFNNGCARDSIQDLVGHVTPKREKVSFDFAIQRGLFSDDYTGSLAYAVHAPGMKRVLQVQLNNFPTYEVSFDSLSGVRKLHYEITSSLPWLEHLFKSYLTVPAFGTPADRPFDFAVVHMHDPDGAAGDPGFDNLLKNNDVAAVFAGHYHGVLGFYRTIGGVPVFLSGSASTRTYLIVEHDTDASELRVYSVRDNDPGQKKLAATVPIPRRS